VLLGLGGPHAEEQSPLRNPVVHGVDEGCGKDLRPRVRRKQYTPPMSHEEAAEALPNYEKLTDFEQGVMGALAGTQAHPVGAWALGKLESFSTSPFGKLLSAFDVGAEVLERGTGFLTQWADAVGDEELAQALRRIAKPSKTFLMISGESLRIQTPNNEGCIYLIALMHYQIVRRCKGASTKEPMALVKLNSYPKYSGESPDHLPTRTFACSSSVKYAITSGLRLVKKQLGQVVEP